MESSFDRAFRSVIYCQNLSAIRDKESGSGIVRGMVQPTFRGDKPPTGTAGNTRPQWRHCRLSKSRRSRSAGWWTNHNVDMSTPAQTTGIAQPSSAPRPARQSQH